jgi:NAD-dependent dihydropyrimidine dehydrogenase PreA subunit
MKKTKRTIIHIDEEKCDGCGLCIPNCPEGALQIIDEKARLISDLFCDGLGACIGHCPQDAISTEEREAEEYDERKVMENIVKQGKNVIKAHLAHLKEHGQFELIKQAMDFLQEKNIEIALEEVLPVGSKAGAGFSGCPGSQVIDFTEEKKSTEEASPKAKGQSRLRQWPVQIKLVPPIAPYLNNSNLLIAADCVPFAYPDFHDDFLKGKVLLVGCPKLDDAQYYQDKITNIFQENNIKSVTCLNMEVPCCFGLVSLIQNAIKASGKDIPLTQVTIGIKGDIKGKKDE